MSLEDIREKKSSVWLYVVIGLLLVGMAGFGTSQFGSAFGGSDAVALSLKDSEVSVSDFNRALNSNRQRYTNLDDATVKELTLSQFRQQLAIDNYLKRYPITASDLTVDDAIRNNPAFFENGKFSEDAFRKAVSVEPRAYRKAIADDLALSNFQRAIVQTSIVSDAEVAPYLELQQLSRDLLLAKIAKSRFSAKVEESEVAAYYQSHLAEYMTDERVNIEYIDLNPKQIAQTITISDAEIIAAAQSPRQVNYYLFKDATSAHSAHQRVASGETIEHIKTTFADNIEDSGELANLTAIVDKDSLLPQGALDAIFALTQLGQITAPIVVDGDSYVFELTSEPKAMVTDAEKQQSKQRIQTQRVAEKVTEIGKKLDKAYYDNKSSDLSQLAELTGLSTQQSGLVALHSGVGVFNFEALVNAIESSDKTISKLQEPVTEGDRVVLYRLTAVEAPKQKPLETVRADIEKQLVEEKVIEQVQNAADALIVGAKSDGLSAAASMNGYPVQSMVNFNGQVNGFLDERAVAAMNQQAPLVGDKRAQKITTANGDVIVYTNTNIRLGKLDNDAKLLIKQSLQNRVGNLELFAFLNTITSQSDIKMRTGLLDKKEPQ